jgi:nickel transport protein
MKKFGRLTTSCLIAAGVIASTVISVQSQAHGIWFAQRARQLALIYGVGSEDLDMVKRMPLLNTTTGYDADWKPVPTRLRVAGPIPVVDSDAPTAAVAASMDYGLWSKTADGEWFNKGRDEVPGAILAERTFKYAVHLAQPLKQPVPLLEGHRLQVVPVGTDIPLEIGKPFSVKVFFEGKPLAGANVVTDFVNDPDMPPLKTGADGVATFRMRNQGLNVIAAMIVGKSDQPKKYDQIEYRATLTFILPHAPE